MVKIKGDQSIEGYMPVDVFAAGTRKENLPNNLELVELSTEDEILQLGTVIDVDLTIPHVPVKIPGLINNKLFIPAKVVECKPGELMLIEGETDLVSTALLLELEKIKGKKATLVRHELAVECHVNRFIKPIVEAAIKGSLGQEVDEFSQQHVANILQFLERTPTPIKQRQTKKAVSKTKPSAAAA